MIKINLEFTGETFFRIDGTFIPKARPRFNRKTGTVYMDTEYTNSQAKLMRELVNQWEGGTCKQAHLICLFKGQLNGDNDNLVGAVLDALKKGKIIADDRKINIPLLHIQWEPSDWTGALIYLKPLQMCLPNSSVRKAKLNFEFPEL